MDRKLTATKRSNDEDNDTIPKKRMIPSGSGNNAIDDEHKNLLDSLPPELLDMIYERTDGLAFKEISRTNTNTRAFIVSRKDKYRFSLDYAKLLPRSALGYPYEPYSLEIWQRGKKTSYDFRATYTRRTLTGISFVGKERRFDSLNETSLAIFDPKVLLLPHNIFVPWVDNAFKRMCALLPISWIQNSKELILYEVEPRWNEFIAKIRMVLEVLPNLERVSFDYNNRSQSDQEVATSRLVGGSIIDNFIDSRPTGKLNKLIFTSNLFEYDHNSRKTIEIVLKDLPNVREVLLRQNAAYTVESIRRLLILLEFDSPTVELSFDKIIGEQYFLVILGGLGTIVESAKQKIIFKYKNTVFVFNIGCFIVHSCSSMWHRVVE